MALIHPDLIAFFAVMAFPVSLHVASKGALHRESGYRSIFYGTIWIAAGALLDYLEQLEWAVAIAPFLATSAHNWIVTSLFIVPGAFLTARGILVWIPSIKRMSSEIERRKRSEAMLRESEERFRIMVEHAPEAITMLDADTGYYVDANPAAENLHGYSRDELVGKLTPWELSPVVQANGRPSSEVAVEMLKAANSGQKPRFEWTHLDREGTIQQCEVSLVRLPNEHSNLTRASIIDVTERKRIEQALRKAQRMEALAVLSGGAAHDFNNLLTVIRAASDLIECKNEQEAEIVAEIHRSVDRGSDLTRQLLAYAKQAPMSPAELDVRDVVHALVTMLGRTIGANISIEVDIPDDLKLAWTEASRLEDALLNLCLNARDAMPDGGRIAIICANAKLTPQQAALISDGVDGDFVAISVVDSGQGIEAKDLDRVFEPFFSTKDVNAGSGLGLAMVYGFAKQTGGFVDIESGVGVGTMITLYIPQASQSELTTELRKYA